MNFFKSVFADDDPEPNPPSPTSPNSHSPPEPEIHPNPPTWGFVGGLIKTITTKSESVIETYRRDLQEFGSGLKMETQVFKEVASSSLEVGASKAQESLESVGQAFDSIGSVVWKSTAQIIAQGTESDVDDGYDSHGNSSMNHMNLNSNSPVGRYSRYDVQLRGIQCDVNTYVEEFEDAGDFEKWRLGFNLEEKKDEIGNLMAENGTMEGIYKRVVPNVVERDLFWSRYYYRVYKLEQAESVRAKLVERANEDEDLSWDVDDEEENNNNNDNDNNDNVEEEKKVIKDGEEGDKEMKEGDLVAKECLETTNEVKLEEEMVKKRNVDEKAASEVSKDSDISVVSSQPSSRGEEEDLGWDEIEDLGSDDDDDDDDVKKGKRIEGSSSSPSNKEELRKRLSVAEDDDEDLSWDIEDDDEPIKKS